MMEKEGERVDVMTCGLLLTLCVCYSSSRGPVCLRREYVNEQALCKDPEVSGREGLSQCLAESPHVQEVVKAYEDGHYRDMPLHEGAGYEADE